MLFRKRQNNKRWQKRPQLYKGKFYYFKKMGQVFLGFMGCLALAGVYYYFQNADILYIESVEVLSENQHLSKKQVVALSGISRKDKLFSLDLSKVADNILRYSWVDNVQIRREFPDKIQIHVTEKQPLLYIQIGDLYFIDQDGQVFKKKEDNENDSLPVITGFSKEFVEKNPKLAKIHLENLLDFYKSIAPSEFYQSVQIAQIHYSPIEGITVFTHKNDLEIFYGRKNLLDKHKKLETLVKQKPYQTDYFARLDLDVSNKIIARKRL